MGCYTCVRMSYLRGDVGVLNTVLQVRHEHQVSSLVPAVMKGVMVNVAENRSRPYPIRRIFGVDELAQMIHRCLGVVISSLQSEYTSQTTGWSKPPSTVV